MPSYHSAMIRTYALLNLQTVRAALAALPDQLEPADVQALVTLLADPPDARSAVAALEQFAGCDCRLADDAIELAFESRWASVRSAAIRAAATRPMQPLTRKLIARRLRQDPNWPVRRDALSALAGGEDASVAALLLAADDPHWRVRHALVEACVQVGSALPIRERILTGLESRKDHPRAFGVLQCLRWRFGGQADSATESNDSAASQSIADPTSDCPFWDWDPAVLAHRLARLGRTGRRDQLEQMPRLIAHDEQSVRRYALDTLRDAIGTLKTHHGRLDPAWV